MSAMEHLVPEQMFSTEAAPANGISAVKAIQLAAAEGQRIYTITRANVDVALAQINLSSDIEAEIRHAAQAGLEVTAHQQPVSFFGRPSVGYIILDPVTATGAYKIGGGGNGSDVQSGMERKMLAAGVGVSNDTVKSVFSGFFAAVSAMFNYEECGTGIAVTLLVMAMIAMTINLFITYIVVATTFVKITVNIMLFVVMTVFGSSIKKTCSRER